MALPLTTIQTRIMTAGAVTFPKTIAKLEQLVRDSEAKAQVIASVVATDPVLSALIIGQANTGQSGEVLHLTQAIRRTGMGVVITAARGALPVAEGERKALASAWAQANACATLIPILVDHRRYHLKKTWDPELLLLAGLVHDLGHVLSSCISPLNTPAPAGAWPPPRGPSPPCSARRSAPAPTPSP
jgi:HD-like signal output (HDOD) protein